MAYSYNFTQLLFYQPLRFLSIILLLCSLKGYGNNTADTWCNKEAVKEFSQKLEMEVQKGITVELVGVVSQKDQLLCRKSISLTYDLWDEVVRIIPALESQKTLKISALKESICQMTYCLALNQKVQGPTRFRILLNPLWEERVARVLKLNPNIEQTQLIRLNAKSIASELPKDIVIYDKETSF